MKEIVVISGKGGTGKTSVTASLAALAGKAVLADGDVDAANLELLLSPTVLRREDFRCGHEAVIRQADCIGCGACLAWCRFDAVLRLDGAGGGAEGMFDVVDTACDNCADGCARSCPVRYADEIRAIRETCDGVDGPTFRIDAAACEGCGVCVRQCPVRAIDFPDRLNGEWYVSETRHGPLVHARLKPGGENSGKLVTLVRETARSLAAERQAAILLVDGPPGIGCPVIASITGASLVLVVTEPTLSGAHDLARVLDLARHFELPAAVCVNKWDLNPGLTKHIEEESKRRGARPAGRIRYDRAVTEAQLQGKAVVELRGASAADDLRAVWERICTMG